MTPPVGDLEPFFLVLVLALTALGAYQLLRVRTGEASAAAWDRFQLFGLERGLSEAELAPFAAWARRAGLLQPSSVLEDRATFDRWVRDAVHDLDRSSDALPGSAARGARLEELARLRHRLGHDPIPPGKGSIVSSRDLTPGVKITVRPDAPSTGSVPAGRLAVAHVDEEAVELAPIDGDPAEKTFYDAVPAGKGVWAVFGRVGETTYRFRARVLERPGIALPALVLSHGDFLVKEERRRTPRIVHRLAVAGKVVDTGEAFEGETQDLSWGGVAIVAPKTVARGARLAFDLPLERTEPPIAVTAKVVNVGARDGGPGFFVNVQFVEVSPAARTRLQVFLGSGKRQLKPAPTAAAATAAS